MTYLFHKLGKLFKNTRQWFYHWQITIYVAEFYLSNNIDQRSCKKYYDIDIL